MEANKWIHLDASTSLIFWLPKNVALAVSLFQKSADAGDANGMNDLRVDVSQWSGGLSKDRSPRKVLISKAAEEADVGAMKKPKAFGK